MGPRAPDQSYMDFVLDHLPWLSGSLGTVFLDLTVSSKMSIWASLKYCIRFCCSAYAWITIELSTTMIQKTSKMKIDPFSRVKGIAVDWTFTSKIIHDPKIFCFIQFLQFIVSTLTVFRPVSRKQPLKLAFFKILSIIPNIDQSYT